MMCRDNENVTPSWMSGFTSAVDSSSGLVVRIPGSHPGGPGSIPGVGNPFLTAENLLLGYHGCSKPVKNGRFWLLAKNLSKSVDEDGIRTHACRAHWISSPTP